MRRFLTLIRKEWRETRALTAGAAMAVLVLSVAANEIWLGYSAAALTAAFVIPGLVALYLVAIASDLVAAEVASRRVETFALLPARPLLLWFAKFAFLVGAGIAFLAWVGVVQLAIHARVGGLDAGWEILAYADLTIAHMGVVLGLACTVFFFSTLLDRGISAVLAGVLTFGAGVYAFLSTDWAAMEIWVRSWHLGVAGVVVALAFSAASVFAYTTGRIHQTGRLRRTTLGLAGAVLFLLLPAAVGSQVLAARGSLEPGQPDVEIRWIDVSPDGLHIALGACNGKETLHGVWFIRIDDGWVLRSLPDSDLGSWPQSFPKEWRDHAHVRKHGCEPWLIATGQTLCEEDTCSFRFRNISSAQSSFAPTAAPGFRWAHPVGHDSIQVAGCQVIALEGGRIVVLRTANAVDLLAPDGSTIRRLYGPSPTVP